MASDNDIKRIFSELKGRYDRISMSTIKSVLKGKTKVSRGSEFIKDNKSTPSLGEIKTAFQEHTCVILTAFRGGFTLEENIGRNQLLKADMEKLGLSYRPVTGCYREADWEQANIEYCYFIYNDAKKEAQGNNFSFFTKAYKLSEKYDQDCFLYKRAGINRTAFLVATTDSGRADLKGDIRFAGQLFLNVLDEGAWTDGSDGRFAFQQRGMILTSTPEIKIKLGEGDLFVTDSYGATGLVVLRNAADEDLGHACKNHGGKPPLVQHVFKQDPSPERLHDVIFRCLKQLRDQRCRTIGLLCTAAVNGSSIEGARSTLETVRAWAQRYDTKFTQIVIVDTYGDYAKALDQQNQ